jgi:hypothetical protein
MEGGEGKGVLVKEERRIGKSMRHLRHIFVTRDCHRAGSRSVICHGNVPRCLIGLFGHVGAIKTS